MIPDLGAAAQFQEGKSASGVELRLPPAGGRCRYLQGALQNPAFGEEHLTALFGNPALPAD